MPGLREATLRDKGAPRGHSLAHSTGGRCAFPPVQDSYASGSAQITKIRRNWSEISGFTTEPAECEVAACCWSGFGRGKQAK